MDKGISKAELSPCGTKLVTISYHSHRAKMFDLLELYDGMVTTQDQAQEAFLVEQREARVKRKAEAAAAKQAEASKGMFDDPDAARPPPLSPSPLPGSIQRKPASRITFLPVCLDGHQSRITECVWGGDGRRLATGSEDGSIRLWQGSAPYTCEAVLAGHHHAIQYLSFTASAAQLISVSRDPFGQDQTLRVWSSKEERISSAPPSSQKPKTTAPTQLPPKSATPPVPPLLDNISFADIPKEVAAALTKRTIWSGVACAVFQKPITSVTFATAFGASASSGITAPYEHIGDYGRVLQLNPQKHNEPSLGNSPLYISVGDVSGEVHLLRIRGVVLPRGLPAKVMHKFTVTRTNIRMTAEPVCASPYCPDQQVFSLLHSHLTKIQAKHDRCQYRATPADYDSLETTKCRYTQRPVIICPWVLKDPFGLGNVKVGLEGKAVELPTSPRSLTSPRKSNSPRNSRSTTSRRSPRGNVRTKGRGWGASPKVSKSSPRNKNNWVVLPAVSGAMGPEDIDSDDEEATLLSAVSEKATSTTSQKMATSPKKKK
jgi:hypothetical protein